MTHSSEDTGDRIFFSYRCFMSDYFRYEEYRYSLTTLPSVFHEWTVVERVDDVGQQRFFCNSPAVCCLAITCSHIGIINFVVYILALNL